MEETSFRHHLNYLKVTVTKDALAILSISFQAVYTNTNLRLFFRISMTILLRLPDVTLQVLESPRCHAWGST